MTSPDFSEPDHVDELLTGKHAPDAARVRPALLARTTSLVRRRRLVRRLGLLAALAGCYLAGITTVQGWRSFSAGPRASAVEQNVLPADEPRQPSPATLRESQPPETRPHWLPLRPEEIDSVIARADFDEIRQTGDRLLNEKGDLLAALHCYASALDRASADELAISAEKDSFLMAAIKLDRIKENRHDDPGT
jgi:hypothetical protein